METHEQKTPMRDMALRAVAVLGLIAVLLLGAWGIIQLAVAIPNLFSNFGGGVSNTSQKESLTVSSAANITSGQTLQVSWNHANKSGSYAYSLSYACQKGLSVKAPLPTGSYQAIECNKPFNFVNAGERMVVLPTATGATLPLTFTVSATKLSTGTVTAHGTSTTAVAPAAVAATPAKTPAKTAVSKNTSSSYYAAPVAQALYGYGDLAVYISSVAPAQSGLTAVKFTVTNTGTNSIPMGWVFNATLPLNGSYTFMSQPQRTLLPGDKIVYTLTYSDTNGYNGNYNSGYGYTGAGYYTGPGYYTGAGGYTCNGYAVCYPPSVSYDPADYNYGNYNYGYSSGYNANYNYGYSNGPVTITVDPQNAVWESNEYNNTATAY